MMMVRSKRTKERRWKKTNDNKTGKRKSKRTRKRKRKAPKEWKTMAAQCFWKGPTGAGCLALERFFRLANVSYKILNGRKGNA